MLFLWIFGNNVEDSMGRVRFLAFYLLAGSRRRRCRSRIDPTRRSRTSAPPGAIAGVLGGYLVLFPRARVVTVIFIVFFFTHRRAARRCSILGFWFVQQVLFGYFDLDSAGAEGGVAYFAHIGGFAFGLLAIRLFADDRKRAATAAT